MMSKMLKKFGWNRNSKKESNFKIGIVSINLYNSQLNLACPLHGYAFQSFLEQNGYQCEIIDYVPGFYPRDFDGRHPYNYYLDHPYSDQEKQAKILKKWKRLYSQHEVRYDKIWDFINTHLKLSNEKYWAERFNEKDPGYDCYICCTDVIWKREKSGFDQGFFLRGRYLEGKNKIAYSAGRGPSQYTEGEGELVKGWLQDFDAISVREKSFKDYLSALLEKDVPLVLDPVFLHDKNFYLNLAVKPKEKNYVLICLVMEKNRDVVETAVHFAEEHNLKVIELSAKLHDKEIPEGTKHKVRYDTGIEEWLGYMANAEYIFTNSFHTCCFSIIFEKQFWAGKRGGDKIDSVLHLMHLDDRRINIPSAPEDTLERRIDYGTVNPVKEELIDESKEYILSALKKVEKKRKHKHN